MRQRSLINRNADENIEEDHWLKQFEKTLQKGAVQSVQNESFLDQIHSVMNSNKSKHSSVAAAVQDMQERSGLLAYLKKVKTSEENTSDNNRKNAQVQAQTPVQVPSTTPVQAPAQTPTVIKKNPMIMSTLNNYIKATRGNLPVPAIIDKIRSIHQSDVSDAKDWDEENLIKLVSQLNLKAKQDNPNNFDTDQNLGTHNSDNDSEIDPSNTDAFHSLTPARM